MASYPTNLYQVMKFPSPDGQSIMEIYVNKVEEKHDCFTTSWISGVVPMDKYDPKVNYTARVTADNMSSTTNATASTIIQPKQVNIHTKENPKMINT